ncbi:hypothetical protein [Actinophytocola sp.]|uniref:hypothetical protein n=1 Tax=Actinophytocola sp. TaxID=1872138 RepID=UPI0038999F2C
MVELIALLAGVALVLAVWSSVLRTVIAPRGRSSRLMRAATRATSVVTGTVARWLPPVARGQVLDLTGPVALLATLSCWVGGTLLGFALTAPAIGGADLTCDALVAFPLLDAGPVPLAVVAWLSVAVTLALFTVLVTRILAAYSRRERTVAGLAMRALRPPDAERLLAHHLTSGSRDHLDQTFAHWTAWLADVRTTHTAFPPLTYLGPATELCWLDAAVLVLDAAALADAVAPRWVPPGVHSVLQAGTTCLPQLSARLGIQIPRPAVSLQGREECNFEQSMQVAVTAGLPRDRGYADAWATFQDWRTCYTPYAIAIAERLRYDQAHCLAPTLRDVPPAD